MTTDLKSAHQLAAGIEADILQVDAQREHLSTAGIDHFHKALQDHLPAMTEQTVDGWLQQANALAGARRGAEE